MEVLVHTRDGHKFPVPRDWMACRELSQGKIRVWYWPEAYNKFGPEKILNTSVMDRLPNIETNNWFGHYRGFIANGPGYEIVNGNEGDYWVSDIRQD